MISLVLLHRFLRLGECTPQALQKGGVTPILTELVASA